MKNYYRVLGTFFGILILMSSCSNKDDIDKLVINEWEKCSDKDNCIIDFSTVMSFEWDKMFYLSSALSLEEINTVLGIELNDFTDIGDRIVFMKEDKILYHKEWFNNPSVKPKGVVFSIDDRLIEVNKTKAKFKIKKSGTLYYLEPLKGHIPD